jgi:hypothetical protein
VCRPTGVPVEIQSDDERGPRSVVTNLCDAPLTAFFLQSFSPKDEKAAGGRLWDAFTQNASPIGKGAIFRFRSVKLSVNHFRINLKWLLRYGPMGAHLRIPQD